MLDQTAQAAFAAMLAAAGRTIGGKWYTLRDSVTSNCHGQGWSDNRGPRHGRCDGWIAPLNTVSECRCPCHDEHRPEFYAAKRAVLLAMPEDERRSWIAHNPAAAAYL